MVSLILVLLPEIMYKLRLLRLKIGFATFRPERILINRSP